MYIHTCVRVRVHVQNLNVLKHSFFPVSVSFLIVKDFVTIFQIKILKLMEEQPGFRAAPGYPWSIPVIA